MLATNDNYPDPGRPPWQRTPWWHGLRQHDWIVVGFITVCVIVTVTFFALIALVHEAL